MDARVNIAGLIPVPDSTGAWKVEGEEEEEEEEKEPAGN